MENILEVRDLAVEYRTDGKVVKAVNGITFDLPYGKTLGIVGETGAGKTTLALSIMGLVPEPAGRITGGSIVFEGQELIGRPDKDLRGIRGNKISMIFADPMTALNPIMRVGEQIEEVIVQHQKISAKDAQEKAMEMLEMVGIPAARSMEYPHQFSGGMKQRVVIAMALACNPTLLLADEPTTALDVTIQAQVLDMMNDLKQKLGTSVLMITHDLGIVAECCNYVAIMYAGEIVEYGDLRQIYRETAHPYTKGLFGSLPSLDKKAERLQPIAGLMPDPARLPAGCKFHPRCPRCTEKCRSVEPETIDLGGGHLVKCHLCGTGEEETA